MKNLTSHTIIKDFIAIGASEEQAEKVVDNIITLVKSEITASEANFSNMATKTDLFNLKSELKDDISQLNTSVSEIKTTLKWGMAVLIGILSLLVKITFLK